MALLHFHIFVSVRKIQIATTLYLTSIPFCSPILVTDLNVEQMQKGRNKAEEKMSGYDINQFSPKEGKKVLRMTTKKVHLLSSHAICTTITTSSED